MLWQELFKQCNLAFRGTQQSAVSEHFSAGLSLLPILSVQLTLIINRVYILQCTQECYHINIYLFPAITFIVWHYWITTW